MGKDKKKKMSSFENLQNMFNPIQDMGDAICYIHENVPAARACDYCKKPICKDDIVSPYTAGQSIITSGKKWKDIPMFVCPNCVEEVKKKYKSSAWKQFKYHHDKKMSSM